MSSFKRAAIVAGCAIASGSLPLLAAMGSETKTGESLVAEGSQLPKGMLDSKHLGLHLIVLLSKSCQLCEPVEKHIRSYIKHNPGAPVLILNKDKLSPPQTALDPHGITPALYFVDSNGIVVASTVTVQGFPMDVLKRLLDGTEKDPIGYMSLGSGSLRLEVIMPRSYLADSKRPIPGVIEVSVQPDGSVRWKPSSPGRDWLPLDVASSQAWVHLSRKFGRHEYMWHASGYATSRPLGPS